MIGHKEVEIRANGVGRLAGVLAATAVGAASLAIGPATALGGLVGTQAGPFRYVSDKAKAPDDGWRATVQLSPGADPAALLVHAICVKPA